MDSGLQCLLLSTDDKSVRVLRRVLSEIEVEVDYCSDADAALQKITRRRFEALIVDCANPHIAAAVLKGARSAPANKRAVMVAVLDDQGTGDSQAALKQAFAMGAHFVLFKPISLERTRASFRAVRALMKRERRRHARIPINVPVEIDIEALQARFWVNTVDLGENGMALKVQHHKLQGTFQWHFTLPGTSEAISGRGEVAWEGDQTVGARFCDLDSETAALIKHWIERQLAGDADETSVSSKLTDLSLNACYLETESPFPVRTRLQLQMKVGDLELQVEGLVRVMHSGSGMGVEFTRKTSTQQTKVEEFIQTLINTRGAIPDLQVQPDTIDNSEEAFAWPENLPEPDPLLTLFHERADAPTEEFLSELRKQRGAPAEAAVGA